MKLSLNISQTILVTSYNKYNKRKHLRIDIEKVLTNKVLMNLCGQCHLATARKYFVVKILTNHQKLSQYFSSSESVLYSNTTNFKFYHFQLILYTTAIKQNTLCDPFNQPVSYSKVL